MRIARLIELKLKHQLDFTSQLWKTLAIGFSVLRIAVFSKSVFRSNELQQNQVVAGKLRKRRRIGFDSSLCVVLDPVLQINKGQLDQELCIAASLRRNGRFKILDDARFPGTFECFDYLIGRVY